MKAGVPIIALAFNPDRSRLLGGTASDTFNIWDASCLALLKTTRYVSAVVFIVFPPRRAHDGNRWNRVGLPRVGRRRLPPQYALFLRCFLGPLESPVRSAELCRRWKCEHIVTSKTEMRAVGGWSLCEVGGMYAGSEEVRLICSLSITVCTAAVQLDDFQWGTDNGAQAKEHVPFPHNSRTVTSAPYLDTQPSLEPGDEMHRKTTSSSRSSATRPRARIEIRNSDQCSEVGTVASCCILMPRN